MKQIEIPPTAALVIETNNLRGGEADAYQIAESLDTLLSYLREQTHSVLDIDELVITHDGLPEELLRSIETSANRDVIFVTLPAGTDYYQAKNLGFLATSSEVVAFVDSDCQPDPKWLESLLRPFERDETKVVAGRTTYRENVLGVAATTIDFMYFPSPTDPNCTRNFYANNVAFRR